MVDNQGLCSWSIPRILELRVLRSTTKRPASSPSSSSTRLVLRSQFSCSWPSNSAISSRFSRLNTRCNAGIRFLTNPGSAATKRHLFSFLFLRHRSSSSSSSSSSSRVLPSPPAPLPSKTAADHHHHDDDDDHLPHR